jgi:hypothetical protein
MGHHSAKSFLRSFAPAALIWVAVTGDAAGACNPPDSECLLRTQVTAQVADPSLSTEFNTQWFADGGPHEASKSGSGFVGNDPALPWSGDANAFASAAFGTLNIAGSISTSGSNAGAWPTASSSSSAEFVDQLTFVGFPSNFVTLHVAVEIDASLPSSLLGAEAGWTLSMLLGTARGNLGVHLGETVNASGRTVLGTAGYPRTIPVSGRIDFNFPTLLRAVITGHTEGSGEGVNSFYDVSFRWAGITSVLVNGVPVGVSVTSRSGTDWRMTQITAVPEPSNYAMLLAGLALLGFIVRRRAPQCARQPAVRA